MVVLSNPTWLTADLGFNEEAEISVDSVLPEVHKAKVSVSVYFPPIQGRRRKPVVGGRVLFLRQA